MKIPLKLSCTQKRVILKLRQIQKKVPLKCCSALYLTISNQMERAVLFFSAIYCYFSRKIWKGHAQGSMFTISMYVQIFLISIFYSKHDRHMSILNILPCFCTLIASIVEQLDKVEFSFIVACLPFSFKSRMWTNLKHLQTFEIRKIQYHF